MRHILGTSLLVVVGALTLAQAGAPLYTNSTGIQGQSNTLPELGQSREHGAAREQKTAKHHEVAAKGHAKGAKMEAEKESTTTVRAVHTVTVLTTATGKTKTIQTSVQQGNNEKVKTKTVQMTVVVKGPAPMTEAGTCAVESAHVTSTVVNRLTVTVAAPPMAPTTQTALVMQPATTVTVQSTHTVTASSSQVAGNPEVVGSVPSAQSPPPAKIAPPPASVAIPSSPIAAPSQASSLVVGGAGQVAAGTGTIMPNGACGCMCLCSSGSFPTIGAMSQPPAQAATTLATSIVPQPTSVASGLVVDTSSSPSAVTPPSVDSSTVVAPTPPPTLSNQKTLTASLVSPTTSTPISAPSSIQSSTPVTSETTASSTSSTSSTSSISSISSTSTFTAESAVLPSPLAATDAFSLQLTIPAGPQPTNVAGADAVIAPINFTTISLTSALILGSLAKPSPV